MVVLQKGIAPHTRHVRGSNYCLLNVFEDRIPGRAIIISVVCYIFLLVKLKLFKATSTFDLNKCSSYWCNPWTGDKQFMDFNWKGCPRVIASYKSSPMLWP